MTFGLTPRAYKDHRRYSFGRTFGATAVLEDFNVDPGLTMPDQNQPDPYWNNPALPEGCSGFSVADTATTDDKIIYNPKFNYDNTLLMENLPEGSPCTLQDAYKSPVVYGLQAKGEDTSQALSHRRGPYFEVHPTNGLDYFDSLLSAVKINNKPITIGTPWVPQFENIGMNGIQTYMPQGTSFSDWHAWNTVGRKTIGGIIYLVAKTWQGHWFGDGGYTYFPREIINSLMSIQGSDALTNAKAQPGDIQVVRLTIMQMLISYYYRLFALLK